jgi:hypothetical protein
MVDIPVFVPFCGNGLPGFAVFEDEDEDDLKPALWNPALRISTSPAG